MKRNHSAAGRTRAALTRTLNVPPPKRQRGTTAPPEPSHPGLTEIAFVRAEWRHAVVVFMAVLALYWMSMPRTVTLEDSGLFLMSANVAGISHPPGYPLHSVIGKLFTLMPLGSVAARVNLLSAVFGALACAVLFVVARVLTHSAVAGYAAALGFGASREMWAQSTIAEVYSLNTFVFFLAVALCLHFRAQGRRRALYAAAFVCGLGVSHHWPLFLLSAPGMVAIVWPRWRELLRAIPGAVLCFSLGLLPYAYLVIRSQMEPPISFYGPIDSWYRFWIYVSRKGYSGLDTGVGQAWGERLHFAGFLVEQIAVQMTVLGGILALSGLILSFRRWPRSVALGLIAAFVGGTVALIWLLDPNYDFMSRASFKVYPLIPYGVIALWAGLAIAVVARYAKERLGPPGRAAGPVLAAAVIIASLIGNWPINMRRHYTWAHDYAVAVLDSLPRNAILILHNDWDLGPIGYLHQVEGKRSDVTLYNDLSLVFSNRLTAPLAPESKRLDAITALIRSTDRRVFCTADLRLPFGVIDYGLYREADAKTRAGQTAVRADPLLLKYLEEVLRQDHQTDLWTIAHRDEILMSFGRILAPLVYRATDRAAAKEQFGTLLSRVEATFHGKLAIINQIIQSEDPNQLLVRLGEAERMMDSTVTDRVRAQFYFTRGFVQNRLGKKEVAVADLERSAAIYPTGDNGAVINLLRLYAAAGQRAKYWRLRQRVFGDRWDSAELQPLDLRMR